MGVSATERTVLLFETKADLSGTQAVRAETTALGAAARTATQQAAAGAEAAAAAQSTLAQATQTAAAEQQHLTATIEQGREAMRRANGDMDKFPAILAEIVRGEQNVAAAARRAAEELDRQARSAGAVATAGSVQLGPAVPGFRLATPTEGDTQLGPALPSTTTAMAAAASQAAARAQQQINRIPPAVRTATNSLGLLTQAMVTGQGGMNGLAVAAGNVAQGVATMATSARIAAAATGIGALVAAGTLLVEVLSSVRDKADQADAALRHAGQEGVLSIIKTSTDAYSALRRANEELDRLRQAAVAVPSTTKSALDIAAAVARGDIAGAAVTAGLPSREDLHQRVQEQEQYVKQLTDTFKRLQTTERDEAARTEREAKEAAERTATRRTALNKAADDEIRQLSNAYFDLQQKRTLSEEDAAKRRAEREFNDRERAIRAMEVDEDRKTQLIAAAAALRSEQVLQIEKAAQEKRRKLEQDSIKNGLAGYTALSTAVKNHGTVVGAMAKAAADAVRIHEIYVEGKDAAIKARKEGAAALAAFATGNFPGAALHLAASGGYAAAALAAGAEAAATVGAGGGGGGGGGGGAGASGSGDAVFQARDSQSAGGQVINLYTVDPRNQEHTRYELGRAGVLKRPIYVPPTTGLAS
jgi:hypothetical protein